MTSPVVVTGASGLVGGALVARFAKDGRSVRVAVRRRVSLPPGVEVHKTGDLGLTLAGDPAWAAALSGASTVVHAAARVHVMRESTPDPVAAFRAVNVDGTLALARLAVSAGVRRFVFVSSIKVNGEGTHHGGRYRATDTPAPQDAYGVSKLEAETALRALAVETGLEVVVVRPVLVYGPSVRGNFRSLLQWVARGIPLPLGAIRNARSFVALDNLIDLLATTIDHPAAAGQVFLVSDGEDLSTTDLLRRAAAAMGRRARLLPVPPAILLRAARVLGKQAEAQRLLGSLQIDLAPTTAQLGWHPPIGVDEGLARLVAAEHLR